MTKPTPPLRGTPFDWTQDRPPKRGEENTRAPHRGSAFVRCRRAAATAVTAAVMTLMSVAGIALTSDHTHLVYQRDMLDNAACAATVATMRHLMYDNPALSNQDDTAMTTALRPIAERYILANVPAHRRAEVKGTLDIKLTPNRDGRYVSVNVAASANLGGVVFGRWIYGSTQTDGGQGPRWRSCGGTQKEVVAAADEQLNTPGSQDGDGGTPDTPGTDDTPSPPRMTELVLALDITGSMGEKLAGGRKKITIVKEAAQELVDTITAGAGTNVAVGIVPWHYRVRFDSQTHQRWEDLSYAVYPTRRYYPNPYTGSYEEIPRNSHINWYPDPSLETNAGEWHDLPNMPEAWRGCVDQRRMSGLNPPGLSAAPPSQEPFTMGFYSPTTTYPRDSPISFACHENQWGCFDPADTTGSRKQAQFNCSSMPSITPLTTDVGRIKQRIAGLREGGPATYSTLGVMWGHRLLAPAWRTVWNDAVHPVDTSADVRKVLVLLTDGGDNHLDRKFVWDHRRRACTATKDAGIEIITVFAGNPSSGEKDELLACASPVDQSGTPGSDGTDGESGTNSFTGTTGEELEGAFEEISRRLRPLVLHRQAG